MSRSTLAAGIRHLRSKLAQQCRPEESDEQLLHAFAIHRDDSAFAALVRQHGPMVLHVCRRVLDHEQDAEDAFQATFLVLARNASTLRIKTTLAGYLHGIAYRTAMKAKQSAARRPKHEGRRAGSRQRPELGALTQPRSSVDPVDELSWREVRSLLDEEIARLPEIYRSVFVLCNLEELSQAEVSRRCGLPERTVSNRLAAARKRLAKRLSRRGVELTAVLTATGVAAQQASALPAGLITTKIKAAMATAAGEGLAGVVSASVAELVKSAASTMLASKVKIVTGVLLAAMVLGGLGWGWSSGFHIPSGGRQPPETDATRGADTPRSAKHEAAKTVAIQGHVVDPDGKPVAGAKLVFTYNVYEKIPHKIWAISDDAGRFAFSAPMKTGDRSYPESSWEDTYVVAAAEGYGFAATRLGKPAASDLTLRLVKDDVPIRGRIIDLQGKPVAGARVRIANKSLNLSKKGDLTDWLAALKSSKDNHRNVEWWSYSTVLYSPAFDLLLPPVTTGADGRFEMKGIGRERVTQLRIEGPTIATQEIEVMTRACETIRVPEDGLFPKRSMVRYSTYYGANFELLSVPSRPIVGVVRDKDTGKPLAGVTIETVRIANRSLGRSGFIETTTDKEGCYRLDGMPKSDGNAIAARADDWGIWPGKEKSNPLPHLSAVKKVGNPLGFEPVKIDFALKCGVWAKGRVLEKTAGKPLQASVTYFCFNDNPNAKEISSIGGTGYNNRFSREDGLFQIPVLPGHGLIAVRANRDHYIMGVGADKIKGPRDRDQPQVFITTPQFCYSGSFHTLVEINPKPGEESITCDVILDPGRCVKGTVFDPDGKPLTGARVSGLKDIGYWENEPLPGPDFMVESLKPNRTRLLQFRHEGKKLSGSLVVRGEEKDPLRVRLEPWGILTGRFVTPEGNPLTSVHVYCWTEVSENGSTVHESFQQLIQPDKDGRFHIEGLAAGVKYKLGIARFNVSQTISGKEPKNLTVKSGETRDLGDLTVKPAE